VNSVFKCIYHKTDYDGICSAALVKSYYNIKDENMIGMDYSDTINYNDFQKEDTVIIVDFCIQPYKNMNQLKQIVSKIIWIDHHISAIEASKEHDFYDLDGLRDTSYAGCELTHKFLYPNKEIDLIIQLLGRYDVWDKSDNFKWVERILPFQTGVKLLSPTIDRLIAILRFKDSMKDDFIDNTIDKGHLVLEYQENEYSKLMDWFSYELEWNGLNCLICNSGISNSKLFESLWDETKHDVMISYNYTKSNNWRISFYTTKDDVDCSKIAKELGGGGHKKAAGTILEKNPFIQ
jgi:uncharacterized protein